MSFKCRSSCGGGPQAAAAAGLLVEALAREGELEVADLEGEAAVREGDEAAWEGEVSALEGEAAAREWSPPANGWLSAVIRPAAARYLTQKTLNLIFTSKLAN